MLRKIQFGLVLAMLFGLSACFGDWRSGEYEGTAKITTKSYYDSQPAIVVPARTGTVKFPFSTTLKLGDDTPIPNCSIAFSDENLSIFDRAFKGDTNGGQDCEAFLSKSAGTKIEFFRSSVTRADGGEITVNLKFRPRDSVSETLYEFEFQGRKKGWF